LCILLSCKEKPAPSQPETPPAKTFDCTIVPGVRVGLITKDAGTREAVLAAYGDSARVDSIHLIESMMAEGVVLFPDNPRRTAYVYWDQENNPKTPAFIRIISGDTPSAGADWKTDSGFGIGTPITELEKLNGKPFDIYGFGWDYGGAVTDWKGGNLAGKGIHLYFTIGESDNFDKISGEKVLSSNDPELLKAMPRVATLEFHIPVKGELPGCLSEKAKTVAAADGVLRVLKMNTGGQDHFWFNDGAAAYDGIEFIYDANCKEVCKTGGFRKPLDCMKVYENQKWEVIWEEE
jgi:hypothetical protein